jgi:hypothetical protein
MLLSNNNSDLKRDRIWVWSIPAWTTTLTDGTIFNTCPSAGACAPLCYARKGTYRFSNVLKKHTANLERVLNDLPGWEQELTQELTHPKFINAYVRIHDAGDFFNDQYLQAWLRIINATPRTTFYAYTKEIERIHQHTKHNPPSNFRWVFSYGGRQDQHITDQDRQCDVFPNHEQLHNAGFHDQQDSDLLAITGPLKVGIVVNKHPGAIKAMQGKPLSQLQTQRHTKKETPAG